MHYILRVAQIWMSRLLVLKHALSLVQNELQMTQPLVAKGAASEVEVLRLKRDINNFENQINDKRNDYYVKSRGRIGTSQCRYSNHYSKLFAGRNDSVKRSTFKSTCTWCGKRNCGDNHWWGYSTKW